MSFSLLQSDRIEIHPATHLARIATIFAVFDRQQDSGNVSYGICLESGERYFIKTAGDVDTAEDSRPPLLSHAERVELLRNAARLADEMGRHPLLPRFHRVIESPVGPMLVYDWIDGELVGVSRQHRNDPASAFQRFRHLPHANVVAAIEQIFELHKRLAEMGWIASDFYDQCLMYDFDHDRLSIIDLDHYHKGDSLANTMGRMLGSSRFMAPEELELGATIDERTTVFTLGRTMAVFLSDGTLELESFRGTDRMFEVMVQACNPDKDCRYQTVGDLICAWREAATASPHLE